MKGWQLFARKIMTLTKFFPKFFIRAEGIEANWVSLLIVIHSQFIKELDVYVSSFD